MSNGDLTKVSPADARWAIDNLGFDPTVQPHSGSDATGTKPESSQDFARQIIDFDSEGPSGEAFAAVASRAKPISDMRPIPWPDGLSPEPRKSISAPEGAPLPHADALIVTWTMDEGHALSRVLTPGFDSDRDWKPYTHNFAAIKAKMRAGCPALEAHRLGTYWITEIGKVTAVCFKSDSHMSQDGPQLPNRDVWRQIIEEVAPKWVITTGTGGGIGGVVEVGDVVLSRFVGFDCQQEFKNQPFHAAQYTSPKNPSDAHLRDSSALFAANAGFLPPANTRQPRVLTASSVPTGVVTTDFFGFDDTDNTYHLQGLARLSEMGDAVLGLVCQELGHRAPDYTIVRNVSDPQIKSAGLSLEQQRNLAGDIYKAYGKWSTVCSAIVCWSIVADLSKP